MLSRSETINFAGIHVDRREDEPTSTIDGLCWPTVSHPPPLPSPSMQHPTARRFLSSSSPLSPLPLSFPIPFPRDALSRRRRTRYNETALADAFRAVSAAETCTGNGDFNTDVPGYQSQPLVGDGLSNATIRSTVLELRRERVMRYLRYGEERRWDGRRRDESDTRKRARKSREESFSPPSSSSSCAAL